MIVDDVDNLSHYHASSQKKIKILPPISIIWTGLLELLFIYSHSPLIDYNFNFLNYPHLDQLINCTNI